MYVPCSVCLTELIISCSNDGSSVTTLVASSFSKYLFEIALLYSSIIGEYGISSNNAWWVKDRKEPLGFDSIRYTSFCGVTDYLNSIHVDYRGLIERGLAIKVTPDNNPYE